MKTLLKDTIIGHEFAIDLLEQAIETENMPQSLLITGMPQLGKATLARALAKTLICQADVKPCGRCAGCKKIESGNHPDVMILDDLAGEKRTSIKIDQIREILRALSLSPHECHYKIAVLADFDRATLSAANALLKTLEEPLAHVILILTAQNVNQLLPTIVSRCQVVGLRPVADTLIATLLKSTYHATADQAALLSHLAQGRPGWAVEALTNPNMLTQRRQWLSDLLALTQQGYAFRLAYAATFVKRGDSLTDVLNLWLSWWRDVLLVNRRTAFDITNVDFAEKIQWVAQQLTPEQVLASLKHIRKAQKNIGHNVNQRLNLEVLLLNLPFLPAAAA